MARACAAAALGALDRVPAWTVAEQQWPHDEGALWLTRAPVSPASTANTPALIQSTVADFVSALGPQSGAARVFREGLQLSFDHTGRISVPTLTASGSRSGFVAEGAAIPVVQLQIDSFVTLVPRKLATIAVLTSEMVRSSNTETFVKDVLGRSTALALDDALFDANAPDATRPQGLRYGIAALPASTAPDPSAALFEDIKALEQAIAPVLSGKPVLVMSPARATAAALYSYGEINNVATLVSSPSLTGTMTVIALEPSALASAFGETPRITASLDASLNMETVPQQITNGGIATPVASQFQTDCVSIKVELPVAWAVRSGLVPGVSWLVVSNW
jgi:hypothetical protein